MRTFKNTSKVDVKAIIELLILWAIFSAAISGLYSLYWNYKILSNATDNKQGIYYYSSNPQIKDSVIKPIGPVYQEKFRESIWYGLAIGIVPALLIQTELKAKRKKKEKSRQEQVGDSTIKSGFYDNDWERPHLDYIRKPEEPKIVGKCNKCGGNILEMQGRYGKFNRCSNYPKCKESNAKQ